MKFLRSRGIESNWGTFAWFRTEKNESQSVSPEVAAEKLADLNKKTEDLSHVERRAQRDFEKSLKQVRRKLDRNKVDTGELVDIATLLGASVATPDQKNMAELALKNIPMENVLKWGARGSHAETLRNIFISAWKIDLRGVSISEDQEMELYQLLGDEEMTQSVRKKKRTERKRARQEKRTGTPADKFENWLESGMTAAEIVAQPEWSKVLASTFQAQSPETLRMLFVKDGVVDFHDNPNASRYIGAGKLFGPEQEWVEINGKLGRRSIDPKFNENMIGYVDENGNYLKLRGNGTETIRAVGEPSTDRKKEFADSLLVGGEDSYRKRFDKFLAKRERAATNYALRNVARAVDKNDLLDHGEIALGRVKNGSEQLNSTVEKILAHREDYLAVEADTGVPWKLIAAIHYRESANNFDTYLHNGQPLGKETTIHPKGILFEKGKWKEAAIDAISRIKNGNPALANISPDASFGEMLEFAERYNGMGYDNRGMESPYVWSGTTNYEKGKYVADGEFDPSAVDKQLGVAPIVAALDVAGYGYEFLAADQLTYAEAREILPEDRFKLWSSSGKFEDRNDPTQTTLEGLNKRTALGIAHLVDKMNLSQVLITGATERFAHAKNGGHEQGEKIDLEDTRETNMAFEEEFASNGIKPVQTTLGKKYEFESDGFRYEVLREDDHWDIKVA